MSSPGKWEFPGGKTEPGEDPRHALIREIQEELDITIKVGAFLGRGVAKLGARAIILDVFAAQIHDGIIHLREHCEVSWASATQMESLDWSEPDIPVVPLVLRLLS